MTAMTTPAHRVSAATAQMRGVADAVAEASVWSMGPAEASRTLVELTTLEAQVTALKLRVAAHADQVDADDPVAAWAHATRQVPRTAKGLLRLAQGLQAHPRVADALAAGQVNLDQARVIVHAVDALPDEVGPELTVQAEEHLLALAQEHHAGDLRVLGRRLLEVIAPDLADEHEAKLLDAEERDAKAACRLKARFDDRGRLVGSFTLPHLHGAMFLKALMAFTNPHHQSATKNTDGAKAGAGDGDASPRPKRPTPERLGRAFCELLERLPVDKLPKAGGTTATVVVTIAIETLTGQLERAGVILDTDHRISPAEARRLACTAGIIPTVLGTTSAPLDLGRKTRLFTTAQRVAITLRDRHCTHPGCDTPAWRCEVHHDTPWSAGGPTDLANGRLLCPRHHHQHHRTQDQPTSYPRRT